MIPLLALLGLTSISYRIPLTAVPYTLDLNFDGYVPLFGIDNGKVDLSAQLNVRGTLPGMDGNLGASTNIDSLKVSLNGAVIPFDKDNVSEYFPNVTTFTPQGKVVSNTVPNAIDLPINLPGLDIKRFPDITFLAIEFPSEGIQQGTSWTYKRDFKSGPVTYTVTPTLVSDDKVLMDLTMIQDYDQQEGDSNDVAKDPKDAVYDVKTHVQGTGTVEFDRTRGLIKHMHLLADAVGQVTKLDTKAQSKRELKETLDVALTQ